MNLEERLVADVYHSQRELARIRDERPQRLTRAFKDAVMDVFLDPGMEPWDLRSDDQEAATYFMNMVRRYAP